MDSYEECCADREALLAELRAVKAQVLELLPLRQFVQERDTALRQMEKLQEELEILHLRLSKVEPALETMRLERDDRANYGPLWRALQEKRK